LVLLLHLLLLLLIKSPLQWHVGFLPRYTSPPLLLLLLLLLLSKQPLQLHICFLPRYTSSIAAAAAAACRTLLLLLLPHREQRRQRLKPSPVSHLCCKLLLPRQLLLPLSLSPRDLATGRQQQPVLHHCQHIMQHGLLGAFDKLAGLCVAVHCHDRWSAVDFQQPGVHCVIDEIVEAQHLEAVVADAWLQPPVTAAAAAVAAVTKAEFTCKQPRVCNKPSTG
jgi:hypothetical protein